MNEMQEGLFSILCDIDDFCKQHQIPYYLAFGTALGAVRHQGFIPWDDDIDVFMKREDYDRFLSLTATRPIGEPGDYFIQTRESEPRFQCTWAKVRRNGTTCITEGDTPFDCHMGLWVDVFPILPAAKTAFGRRVQLFFSKSAYILTITASKCKKPYQWARRILFPLFGQKRLVDWLLRLAQLPRGDGSRYFVIGEYAFPAALCDAAQVGEPEYHLFEGRFFPCPTDTDRYLTNLYGDYRQIPPPSGQVTHDVLFFDRARPYTAFIEAAKDREAAK